MPPGAVYVGRPGKWGNPYGLRTPFGRSDPLRPYLDAAIGAVVGAVNLDHGCHDVIYPVTAAVAAEAYWQFIKANPTWILDAGAELAGKDLACWCPPGQPCHGDILLKVANGID